MVLWVWKTPSGSLLWGETLDFMEWLTAVAKINVQHASTMLDGAQRVSRSDVPPEFQRYRGKGNDDNR